MPLLGTDEILIPPEALEYIERFELAGGSTLSNFEVIEYFFEWLKDQPPAYQVKFLREAMSE